MIIQNPPYSLYNFPLHNFIKLPVIDTYKEMTIHLDPDGEEMIYQFKDFKGNLLAICTLDNDSLDRPIIAAVEVNNNLRNKGIGYLIYEYLITKYNGIYSDTILSDAAFSIWKKLAKSYQVQVHDEDMFISNTIDDAIIDDNWFSRLRVFIK